MKKEVINEIDNYKENSDYARINKTPIQRRSIDVNNTDTIATNLSQHLKNNVDFFKRSINIKESEK